MSPQGGSLLESHQGMASGDVLEKSLVRQENVNLDCCLSPSGAPTCCPLPLGLASPFCGRESGRSLCWPAAALPPAPGFSEASGESPRKFGHLYSRHSSSNKAPVERHPLNRPICQGTAKWGPCGGKIGTEREEGESKQGECLDGSLLATSVPGWLRNPPLPLPGHLFPTGVGWLSPGAVQRLEAMAGAQAALLPSLGKAWPFPRLSWNAGLLLGVERKCDFPSGVRRSASQAWTSILDQEPK